MKKKEKMVILVLLIITIILVAVGIVTKNNSNKTQTAKTDENKDADEIQMLDEENVVKLEDGTRYNTSSKLNKDKKVDGMTLSNIQLTEKENQTILLGTLVNTSNKTQEEGWIDVILMDKDGNEIKRMPTYVMKLESGESTTFESQTSLDYVNAYDLKLVRE